MQLRFREIAKHPRALLHAWHGLLVFLVTIFLLMSGVSGPGVKYWWLALEDEGGQEYRLGGLGSCVGDGSE